MNNTLSSFCEQSLQWLPELGIGYYPVVANPYDKDYWENYRRLDKTETGLALTQARINLVGEHYVGDLADVGIGGGVFVETRPFTSGFDVNPKAIDWLKRQALWVDPTRQPVQAVSFWDSLEHIHEPATVLNNVEEYVFTSLPIFRDVEHVLRSKHYKRDEHCWYFTVLGVTRFMTKHGFELVYYDDREQQLGREDILSFVFKRNN